MEQSCQNGLNIYYDNPDIQHQYLNGCGKEYVNYGIDHKIKISNNFFYLFALFCRSILFIA